MTWPAVAVKIVMVKYLRKTMVQAKFILEAVLAYHKTVTVYQANIKDKLMPRTVLVVYLNRQVKLISAQEVQTSTTNARNAAARPSQPVLPEKQ